MTNNWQLAKNMVEKEGYFPGSTEFWARVLEIYKETPTEIPEPIDGEQFFIMNPHVPRPVIFQQQQNDGFLVSNKMKIEVI